MKAILDQFEARSEAVRQGDGAAHIIRRRIRARAGWGLTITQTAERYGLTVRALRYYEQVGLLAPARTRGGARLYAGRELTRIGIIARLRRGGVDLADVVEAYGLPDPESIDQALVALIRDRLDRLNADRFSLLATLKTLSVNGALADNDAAQADHCTPSLLSRD